MHCPYCGFSDTKVIDSRLIAEGQQIRRRRECPQCNERFTTFETAELLIDDIFDRLCMCFWGINVDAGIIYLHGDSKGFTVVMIITNPRALNG